MVDGKPLATAAACRVFLYHKPAGLLTTRADEHGRATVFDALPKGLPRLISVGRLDKNTQGLLILTNDGGLARTLELPSTGWARVYRVRVHGTADLKVLEPLTKGLTVDGVRYRPIEAVIDHHQGTNTWLTLTLHEGKNREIRRIMEHIGLPVTRLIRVAFGPFVLGELAEGAVREVEPWEVAALMQGRS